MAGVKSAAKGLGLAHSQSIFSAHGRGWGWWAGWGDGGGGAGREEALGQKLGSWEVTKARQLPAGLGKGEPIKNSATWGSGLNPAHPFSPCVLFSLSWDVFHFEALLPKELHILYVLIYMVI